MKVTLCNTIKEQHKTTMTIYNTDLIDSIRRVNGMETVERFPWWKSSLGRISFCFEKLLDCKTRPRYTWRKNRITMCQHPFTLWWKAWAALLTML
ncbi:unnamed protein product [Caretta caretta]